MFKYEFHCIFVAFFQSETLKNRFVLEFFIMTTSSFVSRTLSSLVLTMIHSIVWMGSTIVVLYYWMGVILTGPFKHKGLKTDLIIKDSRQLKKIPFHLAIILCEEDISYPDLSLLVCWAFSFGIQWISVYDIKGML